MARPAITAGFSRPLGKSTSKNRDWMLQIRGCHGSLAAPGTIVYYLVENCTTKEICGATCWGPQLVAEMVEPLGCIMSARCPAPRNCTLVLLRCLGAPCASSRVEVFGATDPPRSHGPPATQSYFQTDRWLTAGPLSTVRAIHHCIPGDGLRSGS